MQRYTIFLNYPNQNMYRILKNTTRKLKGVDKKSGCISNCRTDLYVLDCFVPRNDGTCRRHCEARSNPEGSKFFH